MYFLVASGAWLLACIQEGGEDPYALPTGQEWQTLQDEYGNWYYFNPVSGETAWC